MPSFACLDLSYMEDSPMQQKDFHGVQNPRVSIPMPWHLSLKEKQSEMKCLESRKIQKKNYHDQIKNCWSPTDLKAI